MQRAAHAAIGFAADSAAVCPAVAALTEGVSNVMLRKTHTCVAVLGCGLLALAGLHLPGKVCPGARILALAERTASANDNKDDKDKPALSGIWVRQGGELKIEFCDKDVLKIDPHGNGEILIVCKYSVEKEGRIKVKIDELEGKEEVKEKVKDKVEFPTKSGHGVKGWMIARTPPGTRIPTRSDGVGYCRTPRCTRRLPPAPPTAWQSRRRGPAPS